TFSTMNPAGTWRTGSSSAGDSAPQKRMTARNARDRFIRTSDSTTPAARRLSLEGFPKEGPHDPVPDLVTLVVHVEAVLAEEFGARLAFGALHLAPRVDVAQAIVGLREGLNQPVHLLALLVLRGAL